MKNYNYNDENMFVVSNTDIEEKLNGYVQIPIQYGVFDGKIVLDLKSMKEEFERTLTGIEIVIDSLQD